MAIKSSEIKKEFSLATLNIKQVNVLYLKYFSYKDKILSLTEFFCMSATPYTTSII